MPSLLETSAGLGEKLLLSFFLEGVMKDPISYSKSAVFVVHLTQVIGTCLCLLISRAVELHEPDRIACGL